MRHAHNGCASCREHQHLGGHPRRPAPVLLPTTAHAVAGGGKCQGANSRMVGGCLLRPSGGQCPPHCCVTFHRPPGSGESFGGPEQGPLAPPGLPGTWAAGATVQVVTWGMWEGVKVQGQSVDRAAHTKFPRACTCGLFLLIFKICKFKCRAPRAGSPDHSACTLWSFLFWNLLFLFCSILAMSTDGHFAT